MSSSKFVLILLCFILHCAPSVRYGTRDDQPVLKSQTLFHSSDIMEGRASYYGKQFHGRKTANGEIFDMYQKTAAHRELPFDTILKVTNKANKRSVIVRINDRGPFKSDRIIDLSYGAARDIDMIGDGVADVSIEILRLGDAN